MLGSGFKTLIMLAVHTTAMFQRSFSYYVLKLYNMLQAASDISTKDIFLCLSYFIALFLLLSFLLFNFLFHLIFPFYIVS